MIVLDTTVLVYAKGSDHALRDPCRDLIAAVADRRVAATTTVEAIQEFTHVRARRRDRSDAATLADAYAELLSPLLTITADHLRDGLRLFEAHAGIGAFDAVLIAGAIASGVDAIVSADRAFGEVPGVEHVVPDRDGIAALLDRYA